MFSCDLETSKLFLFFESSDREKTHRLKNNKINENKRNGEQHIRRALTYFAWKPSKHYLYTAIINNLSIERERESVCVWFSVSKCNKNEGFL